MEDLDRDVDVACARLHESGEVVRHVHPDEPLFLRPRVADQQADVERQRLRERERRSLDAETGHVVATTCSAERMTTSPFGARVLRSSSIRSRDGNLGRPDFTLHET